MSFVKTKSEAFGGVTLEDARCLVAGTNSHPHDWPAFVPPANSAANDGKAAVVLRLVIVTPVRLMGEGLVQALRTRPSVIVIGAISHLADVGALLRPPGAHIVLIDVSGGEVDLDEARLLAAEHPATKLIALGVIERQADVIRYARAGFRGYVARDISLPNLEPILLAAMQDRAYCSAEIAAGLMQALFRPDQERLVSQQPPAFTQRECEILRLLARSLSNKEIARDLALSVATVKNHIHNMLVKLRLPGRTDIMHFVRNQPWITGPAP